IREHHQVRVVDRHQRRQEKLFGVFEVLVEYVGDVLRGERHDTEYSEELLEIKTDQSAENRDEAAHLKADKPGEVPFDLRVHRIETPVGAIEPRVNLLEPRVNLFESRVNLFESPANILE